MVKVAPVTAAVARFGENVGFSDAAPDVHVVEASNRMLRILPVVAVVSRPTPEMVMDVAVDETRTVVGLNAETSPAKERCEG